MANRLYFKEREYYRSSAYYSSGKRPQILIFRWFWGF